MNKNKKKKKWKTYIWKQNVNYRISHAKKRKEITYLKEKSTKYHARRKIKKEINIKNVKKKRTN